MKVIVASEKKTPTPPSTISGSSLQSLAIQWFATPGSPVDLSVCRFVVFAFLFFQISAARSVYCAQIPQCLRIVPAGARLIYGLIPINDGIALWASLLCWLSCLTAAVGLCTRLSAWTAAITAIYCLGLPCCFGKVDHTSQALIWFALLLASSNCSSVLSLDAVRNARKSARANVVAAPEKSAEFALPLRFMWILLGTAYFFPGWWKLTVGRMEWLNGTYLKQAIYSSPPPQPWLNCSSLGDQPLFLIAASVAVVLFELSFIVMIFNRSTRFIVTAGGLLFHNLCWLFIQISFLPLQACYCALIQWSVLFERLGRLIFPGLLHVQFDQFCVECRSLAGALQVMDVFGRVRFHRNSLVHECEKVSSKNELDLHTAAAHNSNSMPPQMMPLLYRVPLIWPLMPLLAARNSERGKDVSADQPRLSTAPRESLSPETNGNRRSTTAIAVIGTVILAFNILKGSQRAEECLPASCFPIFLTSTIHQRISVDSVGGGISHKIVNRSLPYLPSDASFVPQLCRPQMRRLREQKLRAIWDLLSARDERCKLASKAEFFKETYTTEPNAPGGGLLERQPIGEIDLRNLSGGNLSR